MTLDTTKCQINFALQQRQFSYTADECRMTLLYLSFCPVLPFSCCQWPVGARPAPWSGCSYGDEGSLGSGGPPELSRTAGNLKEGWQIQNDLNLSTTGDKSLRHDSAIDIMKLLLMVIDHMLWTVGRTDQAT